MRMDYALMSLLELQSTSDQMDPAAVRADRRGRPRLAGPEQAGNWAYPQPGMPPEEIAFCLVTGLAGRLYLSGHLNRMSADELALVREGVRAYEGLRADLAQARARSGRWGCRPVGTTSWCWDCEHPRPPISTSGSPERASTPT